LPALKSNQEAALLQLPGYEHVQAAPVDAL